MHIDREEQSNSHELGILKHEVRHYAHPTSKLFHKFERYADHSGDRHPRSSDERSVSQQIAYPITPLGA
ncbi:hypothetical protein PILCRDRAFT_500983 [Piloderma croceum F 1598]|uniref:Uncharacterized protein n=1 Tax=Piloderma croceum (strain F 1598) TaxID=765440 RepID=A0A0C3FQI0_PILCF|nr:hypothetical protein PILCRDRAFT_500983 [Piloderma croceum F 1598]